MRVFTPVKWYANPEAMVLHGVVFFPPAILCQAFVSASNMSYRYSGSAAVAVPHVSPDQPWSQLAGKEIKMWIQHRTKVDTLWLSGYGDRLVTK